ncbi:hypothetical protein Bca52824_052575 [Brassica carinata]|uniref:MATH domain-containing protein n=1 Tax=Brassica carinata TaxID=52824 RepID=A0A8X7UIV9_BRACI|nr:hypothetical protein Bca52824_052575 [Brassica carinata]
MGSVSAEISTTAKKWRDHPPSSYSLKVDNFKQLEKFASSSDDKYQSRLFSSGGYNWKLIVYPKGNKTDNGKGFISMYVEIDSKSLISAPQREVFAELIFFVYNKKENKYFTVQGKLLVLIPTTDHPALNVSLNSCERIHVSGYPRTKLGKYAHSFRVKLAPLVAIPVLVGIIITGAAFGFWTVRKFVVSEDEGVDVSVDQFVKWATRSVAATFLFQVNKMHRVIATMDTPSPMGAFISASLLGFLLSKTIHNRLARRLVKMGSVSAVVSTVVTKWREHPPSLYSLKVDNFKQLEMSATSSDDNYQSRLFSSGGYNWKLIELIVYPKGNEKDNDNGFISMYVEIDSESLISAPQRTSHGRAEFLSRPGGGQWNSARIAPSSFGSPLVWQYYYSKYHLTPNRKKLSREEYEELTQETTREGMAGLAASPGFSD